MLYNNGFVSTEVHGGWVVVGDPLTAEEDDTELVVVPLEEVEVLLDEVEVTVVRVVGEVVVEDLAVEVVKMTVLVAA